jgi:hypothetical protein
MASAARLGKYARDGPSNANSPNYAKSLAKLLDHVFSCFAKTNKDSKCFYQTIGDAHPNSNNLWLCLDEGVKFLEAQ